MHILIVKLGALGDVVRTTAILPALKKKFPMSKITWLTAKSAKSLLEMNSFIDSIYDFEEFPRNNSPWDWIISLDDESPACQLVSSQETKKMSGAFWDKTSQCARYTEDSSQWFGMGVLRPPELGGLEKANQLKKENRHSHPEIFYDMLELPQPILRPQIVLNENELEKSRQWLNEKSVGVKKWVGLNTGAAARWKFKSWEQDSTSALARELIQKHPDLGILILGGSDEAQRNQQIVQSVNNQRVLLGPTDWSLREFAGLIKHCQVLVTSDSLALHLGLANDVPIISFFGPTSASEIDLYGLGKKIVTPLSCHCCYLKDCDIRPHCMQSISVESIFQATSEYL